MTTTNRLLFGVRGERSHPSGKQDGGQRSPRLPFAIVLFLTLASSFGVARLLATLINPLRRVPFVSGPVYPSQGIGAVEQAGKGNEGGESFYRTIIDNNLFRPLGWTPPRPIEPYRLIGTVLARDRNRPLQAIIKTTAGNQTHIVTTGETLDTQTRVTEIQHKQVTLETNGQPRTLRLPSGF